MIIRNFFLLALSFMVFSANNALATSFIEGIEDIPLMEGLTQQKADDNVAFGNEESRFIETYLSASDVSFKQVAKFYTETLPQLGWTLRKSEKDSLQFYRDGESLDVVKEKNKPLLVRITLKSRS